MSEASIEPGRGRREYNRRYRREHSQERLAYQREWRRKQRRENLASVQAYQRDFMLKRNYGISAAQYDAMLAFQGGHCAVCGVLPDPDKRRFHVDHDHDNGEIRGLLCHGCNAGLGQLGDDPKRVEALADYLQGR